VLEALGLLVVWLILWLIGPPTRFDCAAYLLLLGQMTSRAFSALLATSWTKFLFAVAMVRQLVAPCDPGFLLRALHMMLVHQPLTASPNPTGRANGEAYAVLRDSERALAAQAALHNTHLGSRYIEWVPCFHILGGISIAPQAFSGWLSLGMTESVFW
jgi:hypothetical protein